MHGPVKPLIMALLNVYFLDLIDLIHEVLDRERDMDLDTAFYAL